MVARWALLVSASAAAVSVVASLLFVVAPVVQQTSTYSWVGTSSDRAAALPLNPYRPARIEVSAPCPTITSADGWVWSTTRNPAAEGLVLKRSGTYIVVQSRGVTMTPLLLPPGCARVSALVDTDGLVVAVDGVRLAERQGDLRPVVSGFWSSGGGIGPDGVRAEVQADTRFETSPSVVKVGLGIVAVGSALLALLVLVAALPARRAESIALRARWLTTAAWSKAADAAVAALLVAVALVGPVTDDDGFIARILRTRLQSGFVGNYARWNNTPEAPFGWFYELYAAWARVSFAPVWLRVWPLLLGLGAWLVLRHLLLPRLIARATPTVVAGTAASFVLLWMSFGNSVRPEPWFALGLGLSVLLVDSAVSRRSVVLLAGAGLVAGLSTAAGPAGLSAFAPFLVALPRLLRWARTVRPVHLAVTVLVLTSSVAVVAVPMFLDQSLAAVRAATTLRTTEGPSFPWWEDWRRYGALTAAPSAKPWSVNAVGLAAAFAGVLLVRGTRIPGIRRSMLTLTAGSVAVGLLLIGLSPTKLNHHFGSLMVIGPLAVGGVLHALSTQTRLGPRVAGVSISVLAVAVGLALARPNNWWELSRAGLADTVSAPHLGAVPLATPVMVLGIVAGLVVIGVGVLRSRAVRSKVPYAGLLALGMAAVLVVQLGGFVAAVPARTGRYTLGGANLAT